MIFVTVGAQMPFDRLVRVVDHWAWQTDRNDVFAQIGQTDFVPRKLSFSRFLAPKDFQQWYEQADLVISHAGTGSILTALQLGRPILVMPRWACIAETRNNHQVSMAQRFERLGYVTVAYDEHQLWKKLHMITEVKPAKVVGPYAQPELTGALRGFVEVWDDPLVHHPGPAAVDGTETVSGGT